MASLPKRRNLLLCLDAFGTLFTPNVPIPIAYARAAARHGISVPSPSDLTCKEVGLRFKSAFRQQSLLHPNYGKATNLGAEKWWGAIIQNTFTPFLRPGQAFPQALTQELLQRFSSSEGYRLYADVLPFFSMLRNPSWPWENTIVGIISNSDDRVPGILSSLGLRISPTTNKYTLSSHLDHDITFTILSYDVGVEKPHPRIFEAALSTLSFSISDFEKLYIGDNVQKDYFGAQKAGWGSVLLKRDLSGKGIRVVRVRDEEGEIREVDAVGSLLELGGWKPGVE